MLGSLRRLGVSVLAATTAFSAVASALEPRDLVTRSLEERANLGDRLVYCHFMIGIVADRNSPSDYDADMQRAKSYGIDAFALNIGKDGYTVQQLDLAYQSAANNGMKVFISFDFNWYHTNEGSAVGQMIARYANNPAQLKVGNKVFVSSFAGDGVDVGAIRSAAGADIMFVPNFHPNSDTSQIDGALNWMGWDNNGNNKAPSNGHTVTVADGDNSYKSWLGGKTYLAPVSPWFSTHYGPEVSYSKNWVFPGGSLWPNRWQQVLTQGFPMIEIVTWNDYGESHYIGPLNSKHYDDGGSKWVNDMPHDGWLDLAKPYIAAYKNKDTNVANYITEEKIIYWYRRNLNSINCDSTDTTSGRPANNDSGNYFMGRPNGWESMPDEVYVTVLTKSAGTVTVSSGGQVTTKNVGAGSTTFTVGANIGKQIFTLARGGSTVFTATSLMDITNVCSCGIYNYNAYVGTVPPGFDDPLGPDGLNRLTEGLHSGNFIGLCNFACAAGYCPDGPCKCTSTGSPATPASNGRNGCPLAGEPDAYKGLCSFTCNHGYCPGSACQYC
ncbi:Mutanase [Cladobotryum mycophilum]|uniref:Mutanase n=1 Tax=Cladobotryum mycophilum TaxID=491253 RepID=A0ABR0SRH3_9HYPO